MDNLKRAITFYIDEHDEPQRMETDGLFHQRHNEGELEGEWLFTFMVDGIKHEIDFYLGDKKMWIQVQNKSSSPVMYRTLKTVTFKPLITPDATIAILRQRTEAAKKWTERYQTK